MLIDNLDMLERVVYQIKAMLKEPNQENFEPLKLQTVERINSSQQELNPSQKITKEEVQEGEPHIQPAAEVPAEPEPTENTEVKE
jgi:wyosine [tRNA(Phe)-imidazoG37] synthetase (radical SAM superfamily)